MAAITVTATSVTKTSGNATQGTIGETITTGQCVYLKSSDSRWWKAQCDGTAEEAGSGGLGIALNGGAAGQPLDVQTSGVIAIGGTVAVGQLYCVGATAGEIVPYGDLSSTNYVSELGIASTTGAITLSVNASGIAKA